MGDFTYTFDEKSLKSWEAWMSLGYLHYLKAMERINLNLAFTPIAVFMFFLLAAWIPKGISISSFSWIVGWGYLLSSVVIFIIAHIQHPKPLVEEADAYAKSTLEAMIYHAHLHSEIEEITRSI